MNRRPVAQNGSSELENIPLTSSSTLEYSGREFVLGSGGLIKRLRDVNAELDHIA